MVRSPVWHILPALLLLLLYKALPAQETLHGQVLDSAGRQPVPFCSFIARGTMNGGVTDENGRFTIKVEHLPVTLVFTMMGYKTRSVTFSSPHDQTILLSPEALMYKPVVISGDGVTTLHRKDAWTFIDFAFYDNYLLSLIAIQGKKKEYLVLMDSLGNTITSLQLPRRGDSLYTDCLGAVHLFSGDSVYQVYYDYEKLSLPYASQRDAFIAAMLPCRCRLGPYYYFSFSSFHGQEVDYYYINWYEKGKYMPFLSVHDSDKINAYNENYDMRYFLEQRHMQQGYLEPVDSIAAHIDEYRAQLPLSLREQQWLSPVGATLAATGKQFFIVNPVDSVLLTYEGAGELDDRIFLGEMRMKGWQKNELYADVLTGAVYGRIVDQQGCSAFVRIDPHTGNAAAKTKIEGYPFITHPKIRGGYAYFLWKDPYSDQPVKLRMIAVE